jgi:hypothetical protein
MLQLTCWRVFLSSSRCTRGGSGAAVGSVLLGVVWLNCSWRRQALSKELVGAQRNARSNKTRGQELRKKQSQINDECGSR